MAKFIENIEEWNPVEQGGLPDLSNVSLNEILTSPHFSEALRHVTEDADKPQEIVAGFQSAI